MKKFMLLLALIMLIGLICGACASEDAVSVVIIGGADGPTSIFLAGKTVDADMAPAEAAAEILRVPAIIVLIILFAVVVLIRIRKTSPQRKKAKSPEQKPPGTL